VLLKLLEVANDTRLEKLGRRASHKDGETAPTLNKFNTWGLGENSTLLVGVSNDSQQVCIAWRRGSVAFLLLVLSLVCKKGRAGKKM